MCHVRFTSLQFIVDIEYCLFGAFTLYNGYIKLLRTDVFYNRMTRAV